ncbi:hypothetical protein ABZT51_28990 [Streptomyces sp. NPDC005373]|uniref:hypothetical protein n=1 Tax=unclassified Streptomyces TaxID=2593676 RepID=UPI00339FD6FE
MPALTVGAPLTAAGLDLHRTRRTVRLGRAGVWVCLMARPAAFALPLAQPTTTVVAQGYPAQLCRGGTGRPVRLRRRFRRRRRRRPPQDRVRPYQQAQTVQHLVGRRCEERDEHGPALGSEVHFVWAELPQCVLR